MKSLLILTLLLISTATSAGVIDRDVLVAIDGTVYNIVSEQIGDGSGSQLALTAQRGDSVTRTIVPETLNSGSNFRPTLAYDSEAKTLLLVWLRMANAMSSEILIASFHAGKWDPAVSIDYKPYVLRYNLSVGVTRGFSQLQPDGSYAYAPALLLHAVWWEQSGQGELARYALLNLEKGEIRSIYLNDLRDFIDPKESATTSRNAIADRELLRHVAVLDGPDARSVDVLFADTNSGIFHRITLKPVEEARVRIPVGSRPDGPATHFPAAQSLPVKWSGRSSTITSRDGNTIVFCSTVTDRVNYLMYNVPAQRWSSVKEIALTDTVNAEVAISALSRMITTH